MKKKLNPVAAGSFVLGAFVLVIGALISFRSCRVFLKPGRFISYFNESVQGLDVGSPVKMRGVRVGRVRPVDGGGVARGVEGRVHGGEEGVVVAAAVAAHVPRVGQRAHGALQVRLEGEDGFLQAEEGEGVESEKRKKEREKCTLVSRTKEPITVTINGRQ